MTDQTMPADKVEKIAAAMRAAMRRDDPYYSDGAFLEDMSRYIRDLEDLLPDPPLPTLADMSEEERDECKWMQADVTDRSVRYVIATPYDVGGEAGLVSADGEIDWVFPEYVTPRPDLPRMEWPSDQKAEGVAPVKVGDAIESAADPRLDALPVGSILLDLYGEKVEKISDETPCWAGPGCFPYAEEGTAYGPWMVIYIAQEDDQ